MENCRPREAQPRRAGRHRRRMAEYLLVPSTRYLIPLGDLDPREAAPLTDAGLTSYHAVKRSMHLLGPGSTTVVIGAGGLGQMAIQVLKALCSATAVVAVDTSADKLKIMKEMGADEALISGDDAVTRVKDMTRGQGAEVVLDFVGVNPTLSMAAHVARVLGHLTIVGLGNAALPVNFSSPPKECSVAAPFWGSIPELIEVINLAQTGKIKMLVEHFPLDSAAEATTCCTTARFRDAPSSHLTASGMPWQKGVFNIGRCGGPPLLDNGDRVMLRSERRVAPLVLRLASVGDRGEAGRAR